MTYAVSYIYIQNTGGNWVVLETEQKTSDILKEIRKKELGKKLQKENSADMKPTHRDEQKRQAVSAQRGSQNSRLSTQVMRRQALKRRSTGGKITQKEQCTSN
jgi:hypothetical protein